MDMQLEKIEIALEMSMKVIMELQAENKQLKETIERLKADIKLRDKMLNGLNKQIRIFTER